MESLTDIGAKNGQCDGLLPTASFLGAYVHLPNRRGLFHS